jgi:hypothetical protein
MLGLPIYAAADMVDVIQLELNEGCTLEQYLSAVDEFNAYYKDKGYQTEIMIPLHAPTVEGVLWVGRSESVTAFGKAYDHWEAELQKDGSAVSKLNERFDRCTDSILRESYTTPR